MATFAEVKESKDFLALNKKRDAALVQLTRLRKTLEKLPKDPPSLHSFTRNEAKIDSWLEHLEKADAAVSEYFSEVGGSTLEDKEFHAYCDAATDITGEVEILREGYRELLKDKGLLGPAVAPDPVSQKELVAALKTLAESSGRHATATEKQALAAIQHHKTPVLPLPSFNPTQCKGDPLAWSSFWTKFELFGESCIDDKARLGFLYTAVQGDAYKLIKNLQCTAENYEVAKKILDEHYNRTNAVREMLLLKCLHFRSKNSSDYSELVSAIINLKVYISELKNNHGIDIMAESSGENLVRAVIHDILQGEILDKYQSLTGKEYPTLNDFLSKAQEIADRLVRKQKNFQKGSNHKFTNVSPSSTPLQQNTPVSSTIPANISTINRKFHSKWKP